MLECDACMCSFSVLSHDFKLGHPFTVERGCSRLHEAFRTVVSGNHQSQKKRASEGPLNWVDVVRKSRFFQGPNLFMTLGNLLLNTVDLTRFIFLLLGTCQSLLKRFYLAA